MHIIACVEFHTKIRYMCTSLSKTLITTPWPQYRNFLNFCWTILIKLTCYHACIYIWRMMAYYIQDNKGICYFKLMGTILYYANMGYISIGRSHPLHVYIYLGFRNGKQSHGLYCLHGFKYIMCKLVNCMGDNLRNGIV